MKFGAMVRAASLLVPAATWLATTPSVLGAVPGTERLVVISNDEIVGHLIAEREARDSSGSDGGGDGITVAIDYRVDNNGRGPKIRESLRLDANGYPRHWTIAGSSLFGAAVDEAYDYTGGTATWHSQADAGSVTAADPPMYIGGDDSPWSQGLYARALLADADHEIEVLPSGRMKLEEVGRRTVGSAAVPITIYALSGIALSPQLLALDADGGLFASFGGRGGLIREGHENDLPALQEWARRYERERLEALQRQLAHRFDAPVRYVDVHVFDSATGLRSDATSVLVRDGRIAAIGPAPDGDGNGNGARGEVVVDGAGGTLVPGLFDMHAHNSLDSGLYWLAAGVTSTRDMGNDNDFFLELSTAIEAGELAGPRIAPAGLLEARSPYSARIGIVAGDLDEALGAVRWYADHGYEELKTYNSMNPDWVPALVAEARRHGMRVTGHVPAFMAPDAVIASGYDAIAHINQLMLGWLLEPGEDTRTALRLTAMKRGADLSLDSPRVRHTVELMKRHGTALDTTAVILERLMLSRAGEVPPGDVAYLDHMPIGYQRYRKRTFVPLDEPGDDAAYRAGFERLLGVIGLLYDNGIPLLVGTDDTTGFTVLRELELYVKAGIPAPDVLRIATLGAAEYLGRADEVGRIAPGYFADFLLAGGNPAANISDIRKVRAVSRGGVVYFPDQIYPALGIRPFAPRPAVRLPAERLQ